MTRIGDAIAAEGPVSKGPTCSVGRLLAYLPDDEAADLQRVLDGPAASTVIARGLDRLITAGELPTEYKVGANAAQRHRRRECCCDR